MPVKFLFLPALLVIGYMTSIEDLKTGKIRNIWVLLGLIYSTICYIFLALINKMPQDPVILIINFLISVIIGFSLYKFDLWSSGDAKLFMSYALLIPIGAHHKVFYKFFPSLNLLMSIFIPLTIFLLLNGLLSFMKKKHLLGALNNIKEAFKKNKLGMLKTALGFTMIFLLTQMFRYEFTNFLSHYIFNNNLIFLVLFLAYKPLSYMFKKCENFILFGIFSFIILLLFMRAHSLAIVLEILASIRLAIIVTVIFEACRNLFDLYINTSRSKSLPFAIWMFIGALITFFF